MSKVVQKVFEEEVISPFLTRVEIAQDVMMAGGDASLFIKDDEKKGEDFPVTLGHIVSQVPR